jgi:hypothetical protein
MPLMLLLLIGAAVVVGLLGVLAVTAALTQISDLPFPEASAPREREKASLSA